MRGAFWNGRGMGASEKRKHTNELMKDYGLDFIGIQETQLEDFREVWMDQIGSRTYFHWHATPSRGRSGGLLLGIRREDYEVVDIEEGVHFLLFKI